MTFHSENEIMTLPRNEITLTKCVRKTNPKFSLTKKDRFSGAFCLQACVCVLLTRCMKLEMSE